MATLPTSQPASHVGIIRYGTLTSLQLSHWLSSLSPFPIEKQKGMKLQLLWCSGYLSVCSAIMRAEEEGRGRRKPLGRNRHCWTLPNTHCILGRLAGIFSQSKYPSYHHTQESLTPLLHVFIITCHEEVDGVHLNHDLARHGFDLSMSYSCCCVLEKRKLVTILHSSMLLLKQRMLIFMSVFFIK